MDDIEIEALFFNANAWVIKDGWVFRGKLFKTKKIKEWTHMLEKLINNDKFCETMSDNIRDFIVFLLENGIEFAVICHTRNIVFEPQLPSKNKNK